MSISRTRTTILAISFAISYTCWGLLLSLLPPFYPSEAEKKGVRPSQYGFVFGICNLAAFFFAPLFGRFGDQIGAKTLFKVGVLTTALMGIAFGFLSYVDDTTTFISLSYFLRYVLSQFQ